MKKWMIAGLFVTGALVGIATAAPVFYDSFEGNKVSSWSVLQSGVGDSGDWSTVAGAGIEIQRKSNSAARKAYHGNQYIELDSSRYRGGVKGASTNSMMAAHVAFQAGQKYEISFAYRPRTNNGGNDNGIELMVGGLDGATFNVVESLAKVATTRSTQPGWEIVTVVFTAIDGMNGIAFRAFGAANGLGGFIDAVSINAVPVPAAGLLFVAGAAAFGGISRRKRAVT